MVMLIGYITVLGLIIVVGVMAGLLTGWEDRFGRTAVVAAPKRLLVRLLFVDRHDNDVVLDCMDTQGLPLALRMRKPDTPWMAVCITHLLDRWADTNELLEVELVEGPHPRAGIVHDDSHINLPLISSHAA
jgi:hypothetical protein